MIQGIWDQEDMWGAIHSYVAVEPNSTNTMNYLVMGPWPAQRCELRRLFPWPLRWEGDTALQFRRDDAKPFFDRCT